MLGNFANVLFLPMEVLVGELCGLNLEPCLEK